MTTKMKHYSGNQVNDDPGQTQANDGKTQANDGKTQVNDGKTQVNDGKTQANDGQTQANDGQTQVIDDQRARNLPQLIACFDLECTGLNVMEDQVLSIAIILNRLLRTRCGGYQLKPIVTFHEFCDVTQRINAVAQKITGISKDTVRGKPPLKVRLEQIKKLIISNKKPDEKVTFLAHNGSGYDLRILFCDAVKQGYNLYDFFTKIGCNGFIDSLVMIKSLVKKNVLPTPTNANGYKSLSLTNCYRCYCGGGNAFENAHDALADTTALCDVMNSKTVRDCITTEMLAEYWVPLDKEWEKIQAYCGRRFVTYETRIRTKNKFYGRKTFAENFGNNLKHAQAKISVNGPIRLCISCVSFITNDDGHECE
jgi:DNA polymerase III epsilon subunit-like protein